MNRNPQVKIDFGDNSAEHLCTQVPTNEYEINVVGGARYWMEKGYPKAHYETQYESGTTAWGGVLPNHLVTAEMIAHLQWEPAMLNLEES
jgi:hypothetical protein